ncbi:unnamed protein product [Allacma fusca]|uniref:C2 domain-containing protein n=1 Tax=Allacma fusca TaxID=39272 RepID=A0A8J2K7D6_9HEXA|nr:unnamed protein product [Allacma fusca]
MYSFENDLYTSCENNALKLGFSTLNIQVTEPSSQFDIQRSRETNGNKMGPRTFILVAIAIIGVGAALAADTPESPHFRHDDHIKWDKFARPYQRGYKHHPQERHLANIPEVEGKKENEGAKKADGVHVEHKLNPASSQIQEEPWKNSELKPLSKIPFQAFKPSKFALKSKNSIKDNSESKILQFKLSAKRLPKKDRGSKSDPYVIVSYSDNNHLKPVLLGRTTYILNDEEPEWVHTFTIKYDKTKNQRLFFILYDKDFHAKDELIGTASTKLKYYLDHGELLELPIDTVDSDKEQKGNFPMLKIQKV